MTFSHGVGQLSGPSADNSSIARPYRKLFIEGKPIGQINHVFYAPLNGPHRNLGAIVWTPGNRFLFFPGLVYRHVNVSAASVSGMSRQDGLVDHITLESGFKRWHLTVLSQDRKKEEKLPSLSTAPIRPNLFHWFTLLVRGEDSLEPTPATLLASFSTSFKDGQRRWDLLASARRDVVFNVIGLPDPNYSPEQGFLLFEFWVDITGNEYLAEEMNPLMAPDGPPWLKTQIEIPERLPLKIHPVALPRFLGRVYIVSYSLRGKPVYDGVFVGH